MLQECIDSVKSFDDKPASFPGFLLAHPPLPGLSVSLEGHLQVGRLPRQLILQLGSTWRLGARQSEIPAQMAGMFWKNQSVPKSKYLKMFSPTKSSVCLTFCPNKILSPAKKISEFFVGLKFHFLASFVDNSHKQYASLLPSSGQYTSRSLSLSQTQSSGSWFLTQAVEVPSPRARGPVFNLCCDNQLRAPC